VGDVRAAAGLVESVDESHLSRDTPDMSGMGLLERDKELGALTETISQVRRHSSGRFALVEGEAGVGKSCLLAAARTAAADAHMKVLVGRGSELEREFAFGVVRQLFESLWAKSSVERREQWLRGAAEPAEKALGPVMTQTPGGDFSILHGLYWFASNIAQDNPLALIVDDLQWVDPPSLRFLTYLTHRLDSSPIAVVAATRPSVRDEDSKRLLQMMITDPDVVVLHPHPLTERAAASLIDQELTSGIQADNRFISACYSATNGNPLLLKQLIKMMAREKIEPTAENSDRILQIGPQAVSRYVSARLTELPDSAKRLAQSIAVLGDGVEISSAALHSQLSLSVAAHCTEELYSAGILTEPTQGDNCSDRNQLQFAHPLVRAAIYGSIGVSARMSAHARAVDVLMSKGADTERLAAQLLHTHPTGEPRAVEILRNAAADAISRGSPDSAHSYLRRCLLEPLGTDQRVEVLIQDGSCAQLLNVNTAPEPLREALNLSQDPYQRAQIRSLLGGVLMYLNQPGGATEIFRDGVREATDEETRRLMAAGMLSVGLIEPGRWDLLSYSDELEKIGTHDSLGGRTLDSMLAMIRSWQGDPSAVTYAFRAIKDDSLVQKTNGEGFLPAGVWQPLLLADRLDVISSINDAVALAHSRGSVRAFAPSYAYRGLAWLVQGYLIDAEADLHQSARAIDAADVTVGRPHVGAFLADVFMMQGRLNDAREALVWGGVEDADSSGALYLVLVGQARLLRMQRQYDQALDTALRAGKRFSQHGGKNPAVVPWRSEAALCLSALGRAEEAHQYAAEEVELARRWGAARALGRALHAAALTEERKNMLELLFEAADVLEGSHARFEQAQVLIHLGAALNSSGFRADAQQRLRRGVTIAQKCGAEPLASEGVADLKAAGARPRRLTAVGPEALTPSEQRVAELAGSGRTNREIAQRLFISTKTVEVHLTHVYRKLQINHRRDIARHMTE
jgi:DNA-binding CsgD family transcriptional regulator/tetratricopeptide (TPR) repeat protein